jgi:hypothetical protein
MSDLERIMTSFNEHTAIAKADTIEASSRCDYHSLFPKIVLLAYRGNTKREFIVKLVHGIGVLSSRFGYSPGLS